MDGRLLPPALAAWLGALAAGLLANEAESGRQRHALSLAVASTVALVLLVGGALVLCRRITSGRQRVAALTLAALLVGALAAALHASSLASEPIAGWVASRATATVEAVVESEPARRRLPGAAPWQAGSRLEVRVATRLLTARGMTVEIDVPLVMRLEEGADVPAPGSVILVTGRFAPVPASADAAGALTPTGPLVMLDMPGWLDAWAHSMRAGLRAALVGTSPDAGALVAGLAVGDESLQSEQLDTAMRASGLSHLTAVSGGNVAIVVVGVIAIVTLLGLPLALRAASALVALMLFVVLVGPQPSVLRAAVMGGVVITALLLGGRRAGPSVLAASVLVLVIVSPSLAMSWAFALSVAATGGLILLAPRIRSAIDSWPWARRWPLGLREAIALTVAAQVATLPVLVIMGAATGWVALPANLLAIPVVPAVTVLGLLAAIVAPVAAAAAHVLAVVASWPAGWIATVAHVGSSLPLAVLPWPSGPLGIAVLAFVGLGVGLGRHWDAFDVPARHASARCLGRCRDASPDGPRLDRRAARPPLVAARELDRHHVRRRPGRRAAPAGSRRIGGRRRRRSGSGARGRLPRERGNPACTGDRPDPLPRRPRRRPQRRSPRSGGRDRLRGSRGRPARAGGGGRAAASRSRHR